MREKRFDGLYCLYDDSQKVGCLFRDGLALVVVGPGISDAVNTLMQYHSKLADRVSFFYLFFAEEWFRGRGFGTKIVPVFMGCRYFDFLSRLPGMIMILFLRWIYNVYGIRVFDI